jgi:NADH-quinone oxidoreductase subunit L
MFKALLFLGAGAIIHAVHTNDMNHMGGLRKYLPITHITFLIATLTISGMPPFSAYFSKDEILVAAFEHDKFLFFIEYAVAGITAFYMFRLYFNVFWGKSTHYHHTPHESPLTMTVPLMILAVASMFTGFIPFNDLVTSNGAAFELHTDWSVAIPSVAIGMVGIAVAWIFYKKQSAIPDKLAVTFKYPYKWSFNKFYIDEVYLFVTKKIIFNRISAPVAWFDRHVVDASMNGISWVTNAISDQIKGLQSGQLQKYGFVFVSGVLILTFAFVYFLFN